MIRSVEETKVELERWASGGGVGQFVCHTAPGGKIEIWEKPTIKRKDLDEMVAKTADWLLKQLNAWRIEIQAGADELCDRVTAVRRL